MIAIAKAPLGSPKKGEEGEEKGEKWQARLARSRTPRPRVLN